ncbi:MAG: hypothetical protein WCH31_07735 [Actinomycetes bacterium]
MARKLTRREVIAGAAVGAIGATGVYELVDRLTTSSPKRPVVGALPPEQHLLDGLRFVHQDGVEILVPPLHHEIVTARVAVDRTEILNAQGAFEETLASIEADYAPSPVGLGVTVAWGLPYFNRFVPGQSGRLIPFDRRARKSALLDARLFPSDPEDTLLEQNEVAILLRSDVRSNIDDALGRIQDTKLLEVTSLRRGFVGGGFEGRRSLPKQMAVAAGVRGADLIPDNAELFLGFTSTQRAALGPGKIANFETLGLVDLRGSDYFREGTHMHLSHITEDLEAWYVDFAYGERVASAFHPGLDVKPHTQAIPMGPNEVSTGADVRRHYRATGQIGHSAPIQTTSRLPVDLRGADGATYPKGTAIPIRADFNTLDNPFFFSSRPGEVQAEPVAGVHFVVFNPSSDDFHRNRLAMDGVLPDGKIALPPRDRGQGFNSILRTTHRQNFIVPPRRHRSFPLAEL